MKNINQPPFEENTLPLTTSSTQKDLLDTLNIGSIASKKGKEIEKMVNKELTMLAEQNNLCIKIRPYKSSEDKKYADSWWIGIYNNIESTVDTPNFSINNLNIVEQVLTLLIIKAIGANKQGIIIENLSFPEIWNNNNFYETLPGILEKIISLIKKQSKIYGLSIKYSLNGTKNFPEGKIEKFDLVIKLSF